MNPVAICFRLLRHEVWRAASRALAKTGKRIAARMAMMDHDEQLNESKPASLG